jgi:glycosyltransferase involved in cell wall biosynthesis
MKIAIFTRKISNVMGGMERQLLSIADGFVKRGHDVCVITLDSEAPEPYFVINSAIRVIGLDVGDPSRKATLKERYKRQAKVFELLKENEIELSIAFMTGSFWYSAMPSRILSIPIILAERNGPSIYYRTRARKIRHLIYLSMIWSSAITIQFESFRSYYPFYLRGRIVAIPNMIPLFTQSPKVRELCLRYLYAGRLSNQKQIVQLVNAFVEFHKSHSDTSLSIYGEGELLPDIVEIIQQADASNYIFLNKPTKEITSALDVADVMIAPSLWEGFPNSVAEALAYGLPVGGFDDCEGVRDLIINGKNGWLIKRSIEVDPCYQLLRTIYTDRRSIEEKSKAAIESIKKYQGEDSNEMWSLIAKNLVN